MVKHMGVPEIRWFIMETKKTKSKVDDLGVLLF
jgi:hypothetical protein